MNNIVTYAEKMLDSFSSRTFGTVDSLILSWLSYMHPPSDMPELFDWQGVRLAELFRAECFDKMFCNIFNQQSSKRLLTAVSANPRFRDIRVKGFTEQTDAEQEKQFAAVSFQINDDLCYVAFRGTDCTLIGWKEDFNMAFQYPVPSQEEASRYLAEAAVHSTGEIRIGGHSKGGNLAAYSAAHNFDALQDRIVKIYSHDSPGFMGPALQSKEFIAIRHILEKTLPQSSIVGMLLEQHGDFNIVKSSRFSFWQHDPFSWVMEEDNFHYVDRLAIGARYLDKTLNGWIQSHSPTERERFIDSLYDLVDIDNVTTFAQLRSGWQENIPAIINAAAHVDADTRNYIVRALGKLVLLCIKNLPEIFIANTKAD